MTGKEYSRKVEDKISRLSLHSFLPFPSSFSSIFFSPIFLSSARYFQACKQKRRAARSPPSLVVGEEPSQANCSNGLAAKRGRWPQETEMDSVGQTSTQAPQSPQVSGSTTALFSWIAIASNGQASTQSPQAEQFSAFTVADIDLISPHAVKGRTFLDPGEYQRQGRLGSRSCETPWLSHPRLSKKGRIRHHEEGKTTQCSYCRRDSCRLFGPHIANLHAGPVIPTIPAGQKGPTRQVESGFPCGIGPILSP